MAEVKELVQKTRDVFNTGKTRTVSWRKAQLHQMLNLINENEAKLCDAVFKDFRKPCSETMLSEIALSRADCVIAIENLDEWCTPQKVQKNVATMADGVTIRMEPFGVALIIGAWNYPLQLTLMPMIGAIAAGNCVILKPSEVAQHTAEILEQLIPQYLDSECIHVVTGGVPETQSLLAEHFDYIFYTGNSAVGKLVYQAAAKFLTPVTLELGGKSPVYIDDKCDIGIASRRIAWGKLLNCGQTCVAPDYIMCSKETQDKLVQKLKENIQEFYGLDPKASPDFARIINARHFKRVKDLIQESRVAIGGKVDESENYIEPTVLTNVQPTDPAMQEEIFGPVIPIMPVSSADEAIKYINSKERPLAMYVFSNDKKLVEKFISSTLSGGVAINDTVFHAGVDGLPFGGNGNSGLGMYHGRFTFDTFSHKRAVLHRGLNMEFVNNLRCPPYSSTKDKLIQNLLFKKKPKSGLLPSFFGLVKFVMFGLILGFVASKMGLDSYLPKSLKG